MYPSYNSIHQSYNSTPQYPNSNIRTHVYSNKQKVSLIQDQNASNTIMCRILSELENLAIFFSYPGKKYFGYYATIQKNYQDIINQIIFQMKIFESSFQNFIKNNKGEQQYLFPNNLKYNNIVKIVNDWKTYLRNKAANDARYSKIITSSIKYYEEFLNIINKGNLSGSFKNEYENFGKNSPPINKNDLKRVMNAGATAACFLNEKFGQIEDDVSKKGDYKVNVVLNGDRSNNPFYNRVDNYEKKLYNCKINILNVLNTMLAYLERYAIISLNQFQTIQPIYSNKLSSSLNNKEKVYQEYVKYLNKFYELSNSDENEYDLDESYLNKIINDINSWKNKVTEFNVKKELGNAIEYILNVKNQDLGPKSNM